MRIKDYERETKKADMNLLNQYKKELEDLKAVTGIAKLMSLRERESAKEMLKDSIKSYRGYLY